VQAGLAAVGQQFLLVASRLLQDVGEDRQFGPAALVVAKPGPLHHDHLSQKLP